MHKNLSKEIISVFEYIKNVLYKEYQSISLDEHVYILSILRNEECLAHKALSSIVMESTLNDMKVFFTDKITLYADTETREKSVSSVFDGYFNECDDMCQQLNANEINSAFLLMAIMKKNEEISKIFKDFTITPLQFVNSVRDHIGEMTTALVHVPKKREKKEVNVGLEMPQPIKIISNVEHEDEGEIERSLLNISHLASIGQIPPVIGYDKYYEQIFTILSKKYRNNVAICGKYGVGKTSTVKHLANIINERKCNENFHNKILVEVDFSKLVVGTMYKGAFEQKFYAIVNEAKENGNYIFFIDNLYTLLNGNMKYAETDIESLINVLLTEVSIPIICTMTQKAFTNLNKKFMIGKYLQQVVIGEPTIDECVDILSKTKEQYEKYHDVLYEEDAIRACAELCKRYVTDRSLPDSALDMMDMIGAKANLHVDESPKLKALNEDLRKITDEIEETKMSSPSRLYDVIDELVKKQISIKSQISLTEKEEILSREPKKITKNDVCAIMSREIDVPLEDMTQDEKSRLRGLSEKIKEKVIGQDEAVDEVCSAVKRQRVGLGEKNRPAVLMFLGSTGTGKTYLAKEIAREVFGNEKYFVRMDMSEYADKTSINKIGGAPAGYVGYEDDTYLLKALREKKRFVLLLDEFEKSNEEVHNMFLQMFDEGRFTDNHGEEYSLNDVIIIMTSNIGVAEAMNRGKAIGFNSGNNDMSRSIIEKELKKKFKPEFLNRIQKIVYFNNLDDKSLRSIIELEVGKIDGKVEKLGYHLSEDILETKMIDDIYNSISSQKEYGARPIVNEVQRKIEDNIVDYLIDNEVEIGHMFTYDELMGLD